MEERWALVAEGLQFPSSLLLHESGDIYIAETGLALGAAPRGGRLLRLRKDGEREVLLTDLRPPVTGLTADGDTLLLSEGGYPARISRVTLDGKVTPLIESLPGPGNYHPSSVVRGPDGRLYFALGSMTNTGVIGLDGLELAWLRELDHAHDVPGLDVTLRGVNYDSTDPRRGGAKASTGAFVPFGVRTEPGQTIRAGLPCTAAVLSCDENGKDLKLVAWGIRNAFGLGFLRDGTLIAVDQGVDDRGNRPIGGAPDLIYAVKEGAWYGWPDFIGGEPVTSPRFQPTRGNGAVEFVLDNHDALPKPERALVEFPAHVSATKFDELPSDVPEWGGKLIVALFGDERPMTAPPGEQRGRALASVDPKTWKLEPGPTGPFVRPIDVRWSERERALYVLDFGAFEMKDRGGVKADAGSGKLWRLSV